MVKDNYFLIKDRHSARLKASNIRTKKAGLPSFPLAEERADQRSVVGVSRCVVQRMGANVRRIDHPLFACGGKRVTDLYLNV